MKNFLKITPTVGGGIKIVAVIDPTTSSECIGLAHGLAISLMKDMGSINQADNQTSEVAKNVFAEKLKKEEKPKTNVKPKEEPKPTQEEETQEEAPEDPQEESQEETQEDGPWSNIQNIRALSQEKVGSFRTEIKALLTKFGAPNITSLDSKHYKEFYEGLKALN